VAAAETTLRIATPGQDGPAIETLHARVRRRLLFAPFYDERQAESAVRHVASVDPMLLEDGTYFVIESGRRARRLRRLEQARLASTREAATGDGDARPARPPAPSPRGFARCSREPTGRAGGSGAGSYEACEVRRRPRRDSRGLSLMATLPVCPCTARTASSRSRRILVTLPDGVTLESMTMEKPVTRRG
jgi:hypothetical protein